MTETRTTYGRRRALPAAQSETPPFGEGAPPAVVTGRVVSTSSATSVSGWDAMDKVAAASSSDLFLRVTEDPTVIKVLSDGPFDVYNNHWIDEIQEGSKSVRCWGNVECPLCAVGDRPKKFSACFCVISLEDPDNPQMRVWEAGIKIARQLKELGLDPKRGPLNRPDLYFTIRKVVKAKATEYTMERVKERDLYEEFGIEPLDYNTINQFAEQQLTERVKAELDADAMAEVVDLVLG